MSRGLNTTMYHKALVSHMQQFLLYFGCGGDGDSAVSNC